MSKEINSVEYGLEKIFEGAQDFLPLLGTDYVEFYALFTTGQVTSAAASETWFNGCLVRAA
jgi:zinc transporter ZupT